VKLNLNNLKNKFHWRINNLVEDMFAIWLEVSHYLRTTGVFTGTNSSFKYIKKNSLAIF